MEYLEMRGAVQLKADANQAEVQAVLSNLLNMPFVNSGFVDILLQGSDLSIYAEGTIFESYSLRALLDRLQNQLSGTSLIRVISERWETFVVLTHYEPIQAFRLEPVDHLVFAQ